ncbi:hypothetical protein CHX26_03825 [Porphyrobacter sp. HT-58-2]|uniref:hypothetical protein n=1 Tax=Porphyrobacter sp. HT-58-2 TaxID=2023229 RepID=UPI000CDBE513|nr:hypothetical protein [Porphyrobacter sp. HT-58-2]AUX68755.1 hypothetical protein CHX26_03825 [Porphyrobacter sp. HT-58-2]
MIPTSAPDRQLPRRAIASVLAAALSVGTPAIPAPAAAQQPFVPDAKSCAALYEPVGLTALFYKYYDPKGEAALYTEGTVTTGVSDALWRYSNARFIDFSGRYKALADKVSGPVREPGQSIGGELIKANFPGGRLILPEKKGEKLGEMPPKAIMTPEFGRNLTACDKAHGYAPVFWYGAPDALTCAEALYMVGYEGQQFQARAIAESKAAILKHLRIFRGANQLQIEQQVMKSAEARLKRINEGKEPVNLLGLEIAACRIDLTPVSTRYGKGISPGGPFHFLRLFEDKQGRGKGITLLGGNLPGPMSRNPHFIWLWDVQSYTMSTRVGDYDKSALLYNIDCEAGTVQYWESVIFLGETLVGREKSMGSLTKPAAGTVQQKMFDQVCDPSKRPSDPPTQTFAQVHGALEKLVAKGDQPAGAPSSPAP